MPADSKKFILRQLPATFLIPLSPLPSPLSPLPSPLSPLPSPLSPLPSPLSPLPSPLSPLPSPLSPLPSPLSPLPSPLSPLPSPLPSLRSSNLGPSISADRFHWRHNTHIGALLWKIRFLLFDLPTAWEHRYTSWPGMKKAPLHCSHIVKKLSPLTLSVPRTYL